MASDLKGLQQLRARLRAIHDGKRILQKLQTDTTFEAKQLTRPFRKTGLLGASIKPGYLTRTDALVVAGARYAAYIEYGTGIYGPKHKRIVPKNGKFLAWRTGAVTLSGASRVKGGKQIAGWAFAKSVKGRKATPFLLPGAKAAVRKNGMPDLIVKLWNDAA